jgi:hypothetical protein
MKSVSRRRPACLPIVHIYCAVVVAIVVESTKGFELLLLDLAFPCPRAATVVTGFSPSRSDRIFSASAVGRSHRNLKRIRSVLQRAGGVRNPSMSFTRSSALEINSAKIVWETCSVTGCVGHTSVHCDRGPRRYGVRRVCAFVSFTALQQEEGGGGRDDEPTPPRFPHRGVGPARAPDLLGKAAPRHSGSLTLSR